MRIPHTINNNTFNVYNPSEVTLNLVGEDERPLKPEQPGWDDNIPPSLITLCVKAIAEGFKGLNCYVLLQQILLILCHIIYLFIKALFH